MDAHARHEHAEPYTQAAYNHLASEVPTIEYGSRYGAKEEEDGGLH
jgi:hypothetical protein